MKKRMIWGAIFLIPSLLLPFAPAMAQLGAANNPELSGPLSAGRERCHSQLVRDPRTDPNPKNGTDTDQTVMARVRICSWLLSYDPEKENDAVRDYGIAWAQSSVDSRNGYCTGRTNTKIRVPYGDTVVYGRTPNQDVETDTPRRKNVELSTNAAGHGPKATASTHFRLYPRALRVVFAKATNGRVYNVRWNGRAKPSQDLAFANGVKMSWPASEGAPTFVPRLRYTFIIPNADTKRVCG